MGFPFSVWPCGPIWTIGPWYSWQDGPSALRCSLIQSLILDPVQCNWSTAGTTTVMAIKQGDVQATVNTSEHKLLNFCSDASGGSRL